MALESVLELDDSVDFVEPLPLDSAANFVSCDHSPSTMTLELLDPLLYSSALASPGYDQAMTSAASSSVLKLLLE
jgi:hypothetical protein